nr:SMP-30/gluconolactonase/LRE family protein [Adhaeribacter aquaticus]
MMKKLALLALSVFFYQCTAKQPAASGNEQTGSVVAPGAQLQLLSKQFSFTEGPAADKQGNIYFTDQPNDKIWKYSTDGEFSVFLEKTGRSNGMYFDNKGNLITCADEEGQLWSISPDKKVTVLVKDFKGHTFNGPNDLWIHPNGDIYFTDPYYQRPYWDRKSPDPNLGGKKVYYLPKGKNEAVVAAEDFQQPNGIIGTPDGKTLYVADVEGNKTYKFQINKDGSLTNRQLFVDQGSDGMSMDSRGNVYLCGRGITVYNAKGEKIEHIPVPSGWTANATFGGKDRKTLFITALESVFILPMQVKGAN